MAAKILVVDDEPNLLRLIAYSLEVEGYQIVTARNGVEALDRVQVEEPDLIILDVMLPDMSGLEVCKRLRSGAGTGDIPIIMLSARAQVPDKIYGLQAGADEYVTKPVDSDEMVARVQALLARARRLRDARPERRGRKLGFIGAKGGVGTTTVAVNVALALTRGDRSVIVLELRPSFGTLAVQLGQRPALSLSHLMDLHPAAIDQSALSTHLVAFPSGLRVLFGPQQIHEYREIPVEFAETVVSRLVELSDYTVIDLPCYPSAGTRTALRQCDFVALVLEAEPASIASAKQSLDLLRTWEVNLESVGAVVVNRVGMRVSTLLADVLPSLQRELGCGILGVIPPARGLLADAVASGVPLISYQPNDIVAITLAELADRLSSTPVTLLELS